LISWVAANSDLRNSHPQLKARCVFKLVIKATASHGRYDSGLIDRYFTIFS
jgi:hypothetical protein